MTPTFRERYSAHVGIPVAQFEEHLFPRALYFHARPFRALLAAIPDYFTADRDFLRNVGSIRSRRHFHAEAGEHQTHSLNRGWLRRFFFLRVSAERVRLAMEECWGGQETNPPMQATPVSAAPFEQAGSRR